MARAGCLLSPIGGDMMVFIYSETSANQGASANELHGSSAEADMAVAHSDEIRAAREFWLGSCFVGKDSHR